jgi:hypothetical protein
MIQEPGAMITDRLTAKVLGFLLLVLPFIIDVSCVMFAKPEVRARSGFVLAIVLPSLPLFALGAYLMRKGNRLKDDEEEEGKKP